MDDDQVLRCLPLTERERQVLVYLAAGRTAQEAGLLMGIAASTVRDHLESIKAKAHNVGRPRYAISRHLLQARVTVKELDAAAAKSPRKRRARPVQVAG